MRRYFVTEAESETAFILSNAQRPPAPAAVTLF